MVRSRLGLKALGLCALVLGLMAVAASGAQAEAGAKWTVAGADAATLNAEVQIKTLTSGKATLKTKIAGAEVKFNTTTTPELLKVNLIGEGKLSTGGQVRFTGVTTELNSKLSPVCEPLGTAGDKTTLGKILSEKGKGELVLHTGGIGVTRILPETGNTFGKLFFGEECSLPEEVPVITAALDVTKNAEGKIIKEEVLGQGTGLTLKEPKGKLETEEEKHFIAELPALTTLFSISATDEHKATVEGEAEVTLAGTHATKIWKGKPG
jgi:hypothetical protein